MSGGGWSVGDKRGSGSESESGSTDFLWKLHLPVWAATKCSSNQHKEKERLSRDLAAGSPTLYFPLSNNLHPDDVTKLYRPTSPSNSLLLTLKPHFLHKKSERILERWCRGEGSGVRSPQQRPVLNPTPHIDQVKRWLLLFYFLLLNIYPPSIWNWHPVILWRMLTHRILRLWLLRWIIKPNSF